MNTLTWNDIGLKPNQIKLFQNLLKNKRLAHAYIFFGPKTAPKKQAAHEFTKAINCEQALGNACDHCATCLKIEHNNHPDIVIIEPQGTGIKIDQLRELRKKFHYQAPNDFTRVVVIEHADQMRQEAANSLLKFLEEPPSPMVAILLTENIQAILPTIQSRCQRIRIDAKTTSEEAKHYQSRGFPSHLAQIAAQLSYPLDLDVQTFTDLYTQIIKWTDQILSNQQEKMMVTMLQHVHQMPDTIPILLDSLLFWLRDLIYFQTTGKIPNDTYAAEALKKQASKQTTEALMLMIDNVMTARRLLDKPGLAPQSILEQMLLAIQKRERSQENGWQLIVM